jgi:hypothetical protein
LKSTDSAIELKATVTYNSARCNVDNTGWGYFATDTTLGGVAQTTYTATYNGGYDFKATVTIP